MQGAWEVSQAIVSLRKKIELKQSNSCRIWVSVVVLLYRAIDIIRNNNNVI